MKKKSKRRFKERSSLLFLRSQFKKVLHLKMFSKLKSNRLTSCRRLKLKFLSSKMRKKKAVQKNCELLKFLKISRLPLSVLNSTMTILKSQISLRKTGLMKLKI